MIAFLWISWVLLGLLVGYLTYLWYDEKDRFRLDDIAFIFYAVGLAGTVGLGWPIVWVGVFFENHKFKRRKIRNPFRWVVKEIQNARENV